MGEMQRYRRASIARARVIEMSAGRRGCLERETFWRMNAVSVSSVETKPVKSSGRLRVASSLSASSADALKLK